MDLDKYIKGISFNIDIATLTILYSRYKKFILPVSIILVCIVLFFVIVSPQIKAVLSARDQQQIEEAKLATIKNNYALLSSMDQDQLDSNYQILSSALPATKDFAGVINAISSNSVTSGVSVGDFQFSVGDITQASPNLLSFPSLEITLNVTGDINSILNFIESLYKSMPLAEITSLQQGGTSAEIKILFYYKAFPQGTISDETVISPLSTSDKTLIDKLSSWTQPIQEPLTLGNLAPQSSSSAEESQGASGSGGLNPL